MCPTLHQGHVTLKQRWHRLCLYHTCSVDRSQKAWDRHRCQVPASWGHQEMTCPTTVTVKTVFWMAQCERLRNLDVLWFMYKLLGLYHLPFDFSTFTEESGEIENPHGYKWVSRPQGHFFVPTVWIYLFFLYHFANPLLSWDDTFIHLWWISDRLLWLPHYCKFLALPKGTCGL